MKDQILSYFAGNSLPFYEHHLKGQEFIKETGDEFKTKCPFHADGNPSLNVNAKTGQYYCHGCDAGGDIFTFYDERNNLNGDFPAVLKGIANDFGITEPVKKKKRKTIATYTYTDADGNKLHQTGRTEDKGFYQRCFIDGKWQFGLKGVTPVLYNLPEVVKADQVIIVEGEKDCDNLKKIGYTATTCAMGAGKWRGQYSGALKANTWLYCPIATLRVANTLKPWPRR